MDFVVLYFILTGGSGYLEPMDIRTIDERIRCGLTGAIIGVQVSSLENPTKVLWPYTKETHCEVDISEKLLTLKPGEYHLATTIFTKENPTPYTSHDPHTSVYWIKSSATVPFVQRPVNVRILEKE